MFAAIVSLALAAPDGVMPSRAAWYDCLESYAQVAMSGSKTTVSLALNALAACSAERKAFQVQVSRAPSAERATPNAPSFETMLANEDRAATLHVIAFMNRYRPRS